MATKSRTPVQAVTSYTVRVRGETGCAVLSSFDMVQGQAACYLESRPAGIVDVFESAYCKHCQGSGRVPGKSRMSWKPCPVCGGYHERLPETLIQTIQG
jgi:hypothetical protein